MMTQRLRHKLIFTVLGWIVGLLLVFPILWMAVTAFKTEGQAIMVPPLFWFHPTLRNFSAVFAQTRYLHFFINSVVISAVATLIVLLLGIPAAYAMVFFPTKRTRGLLMWILSTKMMPSVGVLMPIYLLLRDANLLDTTTGLIGVYALMNLPIAIWMLYSFFGDMPRELIEAARIDGAHAWQQVLFVVLPLALPGIASTTLLNVVLCWNEAFWSINLTTSNAAPLTAFIATFSSPEGLFWAKLSAASLLAIAPILVVGIAAQRQLVAGLTFGAVK